MPEDLKLAKLNEADPENWDEIQAYYSWFDENDDAGADIQRKVESDIIQGCLQRACEKHGWSLSQHQGNGKCGAIIRYHASFKPVEGYGDSPASPLLAAYLEAMK